MGNPRPSPVRSVKRVGLPGGRTLEIVALESGGAAPDPARCAPAIVAAELLTCASCGCSCVFPGSWEQAGGAGWRVGLDCPNCAWADRKLVDENVAEAVDAELERAADSMLEDLRRLERVNMSEEIDRFAGALAADAIFPMDF